MSSTRVKERKGQHLDFYETPDRVTRSFLNTGFLDDVNVKSVLEPCAGTGAIVRTVRDKYPGLKVTAMEIQERFGECLASTGADFIIGDFLASKPEPVFDRIIANPPFSQAEEFIRHCWGYLKGNGAMAFLLRLPFIASVKRYKLIEELRPSEVYVLSQRPKFGGDNIDSCDYAWVVWHRTMVVNITLLHWIPPSNQRTDSSCVL